MNIRSSHAWNILLALNFIMLLSACWYVICFFRNNLNVCVIPNQFTSDYTNDQIKNLINNGLYKSNALKISQELRTIFPAINIIEKISKSNCRKIIKIKTDLPLYQINNNQVLTSGSQIIYNSFYAPDSYENLYKIYLGGKELTEQEPGLILKFLENLGHSSSNLIFENYIITWHDKTVITFLDKSDNFFYVKTEYETGFPEKLLEPINKLKEKIKTENLKTRKKRNSIWCADIRFGDKIVLTLKGEGEHEGQKFIE